MQHENSPDHLLSDSLHALINTAASTFISTATSHHTKNEILNRTSLGSSLHARHKSSAHYTRPRARCCLHPARPDPQQHGLARCSLRTGATSHEQQPLGQAGYGLAGCTLEPSRSQERSMGYESLGQT